MNDDFRYKTIDSKVSKTKLTDFKNLYVDLKYLVINFKIEYCKCAHDK
jgi:hypothetical protein